MSVRKNIANKKGWLAAMVCIVALICCATPSGGKTASSAIRSEASQARQKARYYYLEGLRAQVEQRHDEAYEYFKKAWLTDPSYPEAASSYGQMRFSVDLDTLRTRTEQARSLQLLRPFVDTYPLDYEESVYYAYVAARLDSVDEAIRVFERTDSLMPTRTATLIHLADTYFSNGDDRKAYDALDRYERIEGKNPQITLKKISWMINRRDTLSAIREATSLIESNPREPGFLLLKGNLFQITGQKDSVLYYFKKAEDIAPGFGAAKLALADYYREEGDSAAYDNKIYEALLAEDYGLEEKTGLLAEYLQALIYDKSNTSRGDYLFSVLEEQYPHEAEVLDLAARYNAAKGNLKTAIEKIGYAIDLNSSNEPYWMQKMSYEISDGDTEAAIKTYGEALSHFSPSDNMKLLCASAAQIGKDYDKALEMYEEVMRGILPGIKIDEKLDLYRLPSSFGYQQLETLSRLYTSVGDCYYSAGETDKAFTEYDNAITLDPENTMALNNYAYFLTENGGDLEKAEEMSQRSLQGEDADNPTFLDTYAWILYKLARYPEALEYQKKAIEKSVETESESEELYSHYADILEASGDKAGADEARRKAKEQETEQNGL